MRQYTILYALTRDLRFGDAVPQHECYHHLSRVTAEDPIAAEERCRADVIPGFTYHLLAMFEGDLVTVSVGGRVLCHALGEKKVS